MYPLFIVLLAALLMGAVSPGVAQTLPADRDLIQDRQQRLLEEQRRRLEALQNLPGARLSEPPRADESASVCFDIQEVRLSGASLMTVTDQQLLLSEYIGLCLGSNQLNEALKAVTDWYLQRGYVTARAYLPEQDLSRGILEIVVIEGTLEGLDSSALATDRELAMAFQLLRSLPRLYEITFLYWIWI